ncbi:hypothetical protein M527_16665 [Sphingobium indicum IP26]|uniref:Uncharacterized protein n=1 Tax=Sphingobium indicum F2 TaxID=1450518 RepID=A0A8E1C3L0_9SPHN|nr:MULTISPECIES: hypothetical protein [Sphingobium]EPR17298.1 hypothetical protein M527_16665 [Sphingobium indicum IP26]EQA99737.1 hypothetical protein L286_19055 [Sphingobium sp. HDIP04]KER37389.1 hypothetical protein AL00_05860 [Sphingobium indicum F2]
MARANRSIRARVRLLVGAAIETAGIAALCILAHAWLTGASLRPEAVMAAMLGAGAIVLIAGSVIACVVPILHGDFKQGQPRIRGSRFSSGNGA